MSLPQSSLLRCETAVVAVRHGHQLHARHLHGGLRVALPWPPAPISAIWIWSFAATGALLRLFERALSAYSRGAIIELVSVLADAAPATFKNPLRLNTCLSPPNTIS